MQELLSLGTSGPQGLNSEGTSFMPESRVLHMCPWLLGNSPNLGKHQYRKVSVKGLNAHSRCGKSGLLTRREAPKRPPDVQQHLLVVLAHVSKILPYQRKRDMVLLQRGLGSQRSTFFLGFQYVQLQRANLVSSMPRI